MTRGLHIVCGAVLAVAVAGCAVDRTNAPDLTGPSEFALSFLLTASPELITQDGSSQSTVQLTATGPSGAASGGTAFYVTIQPQELNDDGTTLDDCDTATPGILSNAVVTTASDGRVRVTYTAPPDERYCASGKRIDRVAIYGTPVSNNFGRRHSESVSIKLIPVEPPPPAPGTPIPDFTFTPALPTAGSFVSFDATPSMAGTGHTIVSYAWDYDDGTKEFGKQNTHDFLVAHTYHVKLTVTDEIGQVSWITKDVTVK